MAQSSVNVTEGSGKRLNTWDRTISATLVQDQFMLPGEYPLATYCVSASAISTATTDAHLMQIMAGSSLYVRIRRIRVEQLANAGAANVAAIEVRRVTTAGSGGTSVTPAPYDSGDSAASATAQTLPSSKGTEGVVLHRTALAMRAGLGSTSIFDETWEWVQHPGMKPIIIPAGTANGIVIKNTTGIATSTVVINVEFVETAWLGA